MDYCRCYTEIDLSRIRHNFQESRKRIPKQVKLLAVVKANAYGHGAIRIAHALEDLADYFAVASIEEGEELRAAGIRHPILILSYTSPDQYETLIRKDIATTLYNEKEAELLNAAAERLGRKAKIHIALDTGMTRIGFQITEESADAIARISRLPYVETEGIFSHFSCADMEDKTYTDSQKEKFDRMMKMLEARKVCIPIRHLCNSAGIMEFSDHRYDMVRAGITVYGIYPSEEVKKDNMELKPALSWKCHVIHVKDVEPGIGVSYGATYVTEKPVTRIATVSVGYADGYPRALSGKGRVLIRGQFAPILGRVCMDQMMVDVTDIPGVAVEDVVTLIGKDGDNRISVEEVADPAGRFNYEMLCSISERVRRIYVNK